MRRQLGVLIALLVAVPAAPAQVATRVFTRPTAPSAEALARLHLRQEWRAFLPTEGLRDGIFSVQVVDKQIFVQTLRGAVIALDPATGATQWRSHPGSRSVVTFPLGVNARSVFAVQGTRVFALDRASGRLQWEHPMIHSLSAAPVADAGRLYLCLGNGKLSVYHIPQPLAAGFAETLAAATVPGQGRPAEPLAGPTGYSASINKMARAVGPLTGGLAGEMLNRTEPQPLPAWDDPSSTRLEQAPLVTQDYVTVAGADGSFFTSSKFNGSELYRFRSDAPVVAPLGQHGETAYVASQDFNVYALAIPTGRILWRYSTGAPIRLKPQVTDQDVYIVADGVGLYRLRRDTGERAWINSEAIRFLAANPKLVYAWDRLGRLLILDRERGTTLATFDTSAYTVPVSNDQTDRLFLASHDGQLICLHDRAYDRPLKVKTLEEDAEPAPAQAPPPKPKEEAKPAGTGK